MWCKQLLMCRGVYREMRTRLQAEWTAASGLSLPLGSPQWISSLHLSLIWFSLCHSNFLHVLSSLVPVSFLLDFPLFLFGSYTQNGLLPIVMPQQKHSTCFHYAINKLLDLLG